MGMLPDGDFPGGGMFRIVEDGTAKLSDADCFRIGSIGRIDSSDVDAMLGALKRHDRVQTIGGIADSEAKQEILKLARNTVQRSV